MLEAGYTPRVLQMEFTPEIPYPWACAAGLSVSPGRTNVCLHASQPSHFTAPSPPHQSAWHSVPFSCKSRRACRPRRRRTNFMRARGMVPPFLPLWGVPDSACCHYQNTRATRTTALSRARTAPGSRHERLWPQTWARALTIVPPQRGASTLCTAREPHRLRRTTLYSDSAESTHTHTHTRTHTDFQHLKLWRPGSACSTRCANTTATYSSRSATRAAGRPYHSLMRFPLRSCHCAGSLLQSTVQRDSKLRAHTNQWLRLLFLFVA